MKIERARSRKPDAGWTMYGNHPITGEWFERWYRSEDKAKAYAEKRNWDVKKIIRVNGIEQ